MYIACFCLETLHFKTNIFGGKAVQRGSTLKTAVFDQKWTGPFGPGWTGPSPTLKTRLFKS